MRARHRLSRLFVRALMAILTTLSTVGCESGVKYSINDHAVQIFRIAEDMAHSINGIEITMEPSYFNYLLPFTTTVTCSDGTMDVSGMKHTNLEDSYMEAINETHSYLQTQFAVADLSYKYDFCWLNFGVPVPIWLRGKVLHSQYFVSAVIRYKPKCRVDIQRAQLLSYGKLTVNIFQWMPGVIGNWLLDAITRNAQDRIFATVEKSIKTNAEALTDTYNPCIVFPAMGKMSPYTPNPEIEDSGPNDKFLDDPSYIGGLLDEIGETEKSQNESTLKIDSENEPNSDGENGQLNDSENVTKNSGENEPENDSENPPKHDDKTEGNEKNTGKSKTEL